MEIRLKKNDPNFAAKKKKKKKTAKQINASEVNGDEDEYGIEDEEASAEEGDASNLNDKKIAKVNSIFKACLDMYAVLKSKFP